MSQIQQENQSDPELLVTTAFQPGGWTVQVRRGGNVAFSDQGYNSEEAAWRAGAGYVKALLRARIQASGTARCAERPAFREPDWELLEQEAPALEGAELCQCGHLEDLHEVLGGPCATNDGRQPCPCGAFTAVAQVEPVGAEVRS